MNVMRKEPVCMDGGMNEDLFAVCVCRIWNEKSAQLRFSSLLYSS